MRLTSGKVGSARAIARAGVRGLACAGMASLLMAGACRSSQTPEPSTDVVDLNGTGQKAGPARVRVDNQNFTDMMVYAYEGSHRIRLGRARANSVSIMVIPGSIVNGMIELRFYAEPLGRARGAISDPIPVSPGDQVDFYIP